MKKHLSLLTGLSLTVFGILSAHDGSQLWMKGSTPTAAKTLDIAKAELDQCWKGGTSVLRLNKSMKGLPAGSFSIDIQAGTPIIQSASEFSMPSI